MKLIINADDLGMTPGTNKAIFNGFDNGVITHCSIMANGEYFNEAIDGLIIRENLELGVHLNLSYGKALIPNLLYTNKEGLFTNSYFSLMSRYNSSFLQAIEKEWDLQILKVLEKSGRNTLSHLDSHRHVHLIPHLYKIAVKLAKKYSIKRIRLIKENPLESYLMARKFNFITNGGIVKYSLLNLFSHINANRADLYGNRQFYSILYTGAVGLTVLQKALNSSRNFEIMVHPGYPDIDKKVEFYDDAEKRYRVSIDRTKELEAVLEAKYIPHV